MSDLDAFADALINSRRSGVGVAAGRAPATPAEAYAVQARVSAALGPVAGFKTGRKAGTPQTYAPIHRAGLCDSGAVLGVGGPTGIELEVGFRLVRSLPPLDAPDFATALRACLTPFVAIELVQTRLAGPLAQDPLAKLADNQVNLGLVVGSGPAAWDGTDFRHVTARMTAGALTLLDGPAEVPGGSALDTIADLARLLGDHCGGLQAGQVVITGSLHPLTWVPPGTEVAGQIEGLGAVSVTLA